MDWQIDPRLENDTILISSEGNVQTRLMDDARWPWIIVVPMLPDCEDIEDIPVVELGALSVHLSKISAALKRMQVCQSTNVATIGNIVKQMHWHVVGRREGDGNWPGPVWGFGDRQPYRKAAREKFIADFRDCWKKIAS